MKKFTTAELEEYMDISLDEREQKFLSAYPPKQKEIYLMKKFISRYKFIIGGTKTECLKMLNEQLVKMGYKRKKYLSTVTRLWDEPFISYEFENDYYGGI